MSDAIHNILGPGGIVSRGMPGYEPRAAQVQMAVGVDAALRDGAKLVVEAGTGTGKTMAYLVPALLSEQVVVISTGTKTLQDQVVEKDLPQLLALLDMRVPVAVMKGISNYLCLRKLRQVRRAGRLIQDEMLERLLDWADVTKTGDRAELPGLPDRDPLWAEVSPTVDSRVGPRCPYYEECFVTRMRRRAGDARLVVVNHHLLFADLALRRELPDTAVLPPYEALIVDEAHQVEAVATSFFGRHASSAMITALCRDCLRPPTLKDDRDAAHLVGQVAELSQDLFHLLRARLYAAGGAEVPGNGGPGRRLRLDAPPLAAGGLVRPYHALDGALEAASTYLKRKAGGDEDIAHLARRLGRMRQALAQFGEPQEQDTILWVERTPRSVSLHGAPVEVGPVLARTLLAEPIPQIFTSATLAVQTGSGGAGPLSFFRARVGLSPANGEQDPEARWSEAEVRELLLPSPFDFQRQTLLYLPTDLPLPSEDGFIVRAAARIGELLDITGGRALVLFTSYRNLEAARELLAAAGLPYPLLCQGEQPRSALLEQFRREVDSVLLATASFWEGVDVVGEALSMVIMDKLPFGVPDEPLTEARLQRLRDQGSSPFKEYQLPQAALALKQGFGRLIRRSNDSGVVAILDRRIVDKGYGKLLLRSLPPAPISSDLDAVRVFFGDIDPPL